MSHYFSRLAQRSGFAETPVKKSSPGPISATAQQHNESAYTSKSNDITEMPSEIVTPKAIAIPVSKPAQTERTDSSSQYQTTLPEQPGHHRNTNLTGAHAKHNATQDGLTTAGKTEINSSSSSHNSVKSSNGRISRETSNAPLNKTENENAIGKTATRLDMELSDGKSSTVTVPPVHNVQQSGSEITDVRSTGDAKQELNNRHATTEKHHNQPSKAAPVSPILAGQTPANVIDRPNLDVNTSRSHLSASKNAKARQLEYAQHSTPNKDSIEVRIGTVSLEVHQLPPVQTVKPAVRETRQNNSPAGQSAAMASLSRYYLKGW